MQHVVASDGLHTANPCRHARFAHDLEQADVARARHVRAATQFLRRTDRQHAHFVAVLLAEEGHCAILDRVVKAHELGVRPGVGKNFCVDTRFHFANLQRRHRCVVREVEAGFFCIHQRALLLHVAAQHFAQGLVHQVGGRVVAHGARAAHCVHLRRHGIANLQHAGAQLAVVAEHVRLHLERVDHIKPDGRSLERALVANLAARFRIERGVVQHHHAGLARVHFLHRCAIHKQRRHPRGFAHELLVAVERCLVAGVVERAGGHLELAGRACLLALAVHGGVKGRFVDDHVVLAADVLRQVQRETVGVVQLEGQFAVEHLGTRGLQLAQRGVEDRHAVLDGLEEARLFRTQHFDHTVARLAQLRIGLAHLRDEVVHELVEERCAAAELVTVADGAADDPAQHIATALIARDHAVDDQERACADVVGNHAQRVVGQILGVGLARGGSDERLEQVDLVVAVHVLQDGSQAFHAHAGVDARCGQRGQRVFAGRRIELAIELHEHVVPDFDVAVAVGFRASRGAAPDVGAMVVEDFRARAARAGFGHLPEVVGGIGRALVVADAHDALGRQANDLGPDVVGLVVGLVDGGPQLLGRQLVFLRQQLPRPHECVALEVVAERPVAEHFEERVVARRIADVFQVVVLAAGAQAALHGGRTHVRALVGTEEDVLELHHAGVGEQQRRVVARHQRRGAHHGVALALKERQEFLADIGGFHVAGCRSQHGAWGNRPAHLGSVQTIDYTGLLMC